MIEEDSVNAVMCLAETPFRTTRLVELDREYDIELLYHHESSMEERMSCKDR